MKHANISPNSAITETAHALEDVLGALRKFFVAGAGSDKKMLDRAGQAELAFALIGNEGFYEIIRAVTRWKQVASEVGCLSVLPITFVQ